MNLFNGMLKKLSQVQESYSRALYEMCRATVNRAIVSMKLEMSGTVYEGVMPLFPNGICFLLFQVMFGMSF